MKEAVEEGEALSADGRCPPMPRRPTPTHCSTCAGPRRRATPTTASWRRRPRTSRRAMASSSPTSSSTISPPPTPRSTSLVGRRAGLALLSATIPRRYPNPERGYAEDDGGAGALLRQPARRGLGPHCVRTVRRRASQQQHAARALPDGQRPRLAAARPGRGRDRRQPGAARRRVEDRADRGGDRQLPLRRRAAHDGRAAGALSREPGRATAGARPRRQAPLAARARGRSPATPTAAAPTPRASR